jgi:histidine triad (HIT) family protein
MARDPDCLFCKVVAGEVAADVVHRDDRVVAFRDIEPRAPLHVLVVTVDHHANVGALAAADARLLADIVRVGSAIAADASAGEFRLVFNTGRQAGQSVFHVHGHVLGGRSFGWPPG